MEYFVDACGVVAGAILGVFVALMVMCIFAFVCMLAIGAAVMAFDSWQNKPANPVTKGTPTGEFTIIDAPSRHTPDPKK